ncbi:MAG: signal peptidase I [Bacilli bacterium]|nr:signal peptidase I [Bacilli bacterium]
MKKFLLEIKDYVIIIVAVVLIRSFIMTPAVVEGSSMDNTLNDGQVIIINKINYRISDPKRFQIVVVKNSEEDDKIIKRIIGLPGETIEYIDNKLYINGNYVEEKYNHGITNDFKTTTSDNEYFVMGDNREVSKDSRMLGNFKKEELVGRVKIRLYPFDKIGRIEK